MPTRSRTIGPIYRRGEIVSQGRVVDVPAPVTPPRHPLDCIYRRGRTRELACGCATPPAVYSCGLLGECVLIKEGGKRGQAIEASGLPVCRECSQRAPEERRLFYFRHGLGDAVQFAAVLAHLRRYRPGWQIDVECRKGRESLFRGVAHGAGQSFRRGGYHYSQRIPFGECYHDYADCPSTKVSQCLKQTFGIEPDLELCRYSIDCEAEREAAADYLRSLAGEPDRGRFPVVAIHYLGHSSTERKNLSHETANELCESAIACGCVPLVLEWDGRSPLPHCPARRDYRHFTDAARLTAIISQCRAFVGIDSGPLHLAGATETPTLGVWTGNHPIHFFDLSENVTHLVPEDHERLAAGPNCLEFFQRHYRHRTYREGQEAAALTELLQGESPVSVKQTTTTLKVYTPAGIGDSLWALLKVESLLKQSGKEKAIVGIHSGEPRRALEFLERFDFVESAHYRSLDLVMQPEFTKEGCHNWMESQPDWRGYDWVLIPNRHLELGRRIEEWLPELETNWRIADRFRFEPWELDYAAHLRRTLGDYCCFYLGPKGGNTTWGHNKDSLWTPEDWRLLFDRCRECGLPIVLVGAEYDRSYWEEIVKPLTGDEGVHDCIGHWGIAQSFAVIKGSRFLISYQCGLGIFAVYLGVPVAMWWRPYGNSSWPHGFVSFHEAMAHDWAPPAAVASWRYLPCIYQRETPEQIWDHVQTHWIGERPLETPSPFTVGSELTEAAKQIRAIAATSGYQHYWPAGLESLAGAEKMCSQPYAAFKHSVAAVLKPRSVLEIGIGAGVAATAFCRAALERGDSFRYVGIDNLEMQEIRRLRCTEIAMEELRRLGADASFIHADSMRLPSPPAGEFDLVHVDGNHFYQYASHDTKLAIKSGAPWILIDDCRDSQVCAGAFRGLFEMRPGAVEWAYFEDTYTGSILLWMGKSVREHER